MMVHESELWLQYDRYSLLAISDTGKITAPGAFMGSGSETSEQRHCTMNFQSEVKFSLVRAITIPTMVINTQYNYYSTHYSRKHTQTYLPVIAFSGSGGMRTQGYLATSRQ